ncbi:hypothetical protein DER45DRAFT_576233 [Fusarium avenaceum]|nr:hypothetical protein DER45DRAFT_576233 [Fusarium avenaceum]
MSNPHDYVVGWICDTRTEFVAAQTFLDEKHQGPECVSTHDNNNYALGRIGRHNVAIAVLPHGEYGISSAASVARDMLHSFPNIRIGLMVGIGGGAPSPKHDIRLGDVVVSASGKGRFGGVFQYDRGNVIQGQEFKETGFLDRPPTILRTAMNGLMAQYEIEGHQFNESINNILENSPRLRKKYGRPKTSTDRLYRSEVLHQPNDESSCALCGEDPSNLQVRHERARGEDNPSIHYGLIASSSMLMKDALIRDAFAKRDVLCFETEAAGLVNHFPCLIIRGICDYADTHKNDEWQGFAAMAAAAYAKDLLYQIPPNKVEFEKKIGQILSDLQTEVLAAHKKADTIIHHHRTQQHKAVLNWLTQANYSLIQGDNIGRRQPGTGQWLLDSPQFCNWRDSPGQTLFCPGMPGAGKTILTSIVIDTLETLYLLDDKDIGTAYVYCNFRRQDEQTARELLASLLKQLLQSLSTLPETAKSLYNKHNTKDSRPSLEEISNTLPSVIKLYSRVFILIDAIDECRKSDGSQARFLQEVFELQKKSKFNIFATSRPIPDIVDQFKDSVSLEIRATDEDVRMFLRSQMTQLPGFLCRQDLQEEVINEIVRSVKGMFLLSQLHLDSLRGKTSVQAVRKAIAKLPSGSDAYCHAYETAMERIQSQMSDHRDLALRVLSWITCAKRPLTVKELRHALAVEVGSTELDKDAMPEIDIMVQVCIGLVTIDKGDDIIRLVHYTAQEYFEKTQAIWFSKAESDITTTCVTYLNFQQFKSGRCLNEEGFSKRLQLNPLFHYASKNWGHHARNTTTICEGVLDFLESNSSVQASAQALLAHEMIPRIRIPYRHTGLHLAAYFGAVAETRSLLRVKSPDLEDGLKQTAIFHAARNGHRAVMKLLLESGAKADWRDYERRTPLSFAAEGGHATATQLLLDYNAEVDSEDYYGLTPLSWAAQWGSETVVQVLLNNNAKFDSGDEDGRTPLSFTAERGHAAIAQLLLENGANANSHDDLGHTPLAYAIDGKHKEVCDLLSKLNPSLSS